MYTSQQASYKALPSSTRSRRASGNHAGRPGLFQADYGHTATSNDNVPPPQPPFGQRQQRVSSAAGPDPLHVPLFQAQYQYSPRNHPFGARPQSSGHRSSEQARFSVADYFDPYQNTPRGQTLNVDAELATPPLSSSRPSVPPRKDIIPRQSTPPSPVMRAVRHSRPTTPNASTQQLPSSPSRPTAFAHARGASPAASASSSWDSVASSASHNQARPRPRAQRRPHQPQQASRASLFPSAPLPQTAADQPSPPEQPSNLRMKPRAYTEDAPLAPAQNPAPARPTPLPAYASRPRVSSMYAASASSLAPAPSAQKPLLGLNIATTQPAAPGARATSELANAAIRDFVDIKSSWAPRKTKGNWPPVSPKPTAHPWPPVEQPPKAADQHPGRSAGVSAERSHLIEFIERQRARTVATSDSEEQLKRHQGSDSRLAKATPAPIPQNTHTDRPDSLSSKASDPERSFKRSTARLAEIDPSLLKKSAEEGRGRGNGRAFKYASWYETTSPSYSKSVTPEPTPEHGLSKEARQLPKTAAVGNSTATGNSNSTGNSTAIGNSIDTGPKAVQGLPTSTRFIPRTRARTEVGDSYIDAVSRTALPPAMPVAAHGRVANKPGDISVRHSTESLGLSAKARPYGRPGRRDSGGLSVASVSPTPINPYSRNPRFLSVGVQTDTSAPELTPLVADKPKATGTRGTQTKATTIHNDEAVLNLMRQIDSLRQGHANQISEYQEHVIDLELTNQDLSTELEQTTAKLTAKDEVHKAAMDEMRQRLDDAQQRVDREIGEVKQMHKDKCNEMAEQISMLFGRCEAYKQKLVSLNVPETELLRLATTQPESTSDPAAADRDIQISDQAFIESQYVEMRDSSQEADYFKQLMDIERSMENTTIALGFELKRTQAKYLQQAADFIREQMARLQTDGRSESRLSMRSDSRSLYIRSPVPSNPDGTFPSTDNGDSPEHPAAGCRSPVQSLAASLSQMSKLPEMPPLPTKSTAGSAKPQLRLQHQRIVGTDPSPARFTMPGGVEPIDEVAEDSPSTAEELLQGSDSYSPTTPRPLPLASESRGTTKSQRAATVSAFPMLMALQQRGNVEPRGFGSEGRTSGLSRMMASDTAALTPPPKQASASVTASSSNESWTADSGSMSDLPMLRSSPQPRSHRSPLAGLANGFFSSSQESITTAVALSEPTTSITSHLGLLDSSTQSLTSLTPTKPTKPKGSSIGYFSGSRKANEIGQDPTPSTMHWPPRSERRPTSRPHSASIDTQDMTAEELLESLKLPSANAMGMTTPTRGTSGSFSSSPSGSLGRQSPLPRSGSYTDLCRTFPSAPRSALSNQQSDADPFASKRQPFASVGARSTFDVKPDINIDLGLGPSSVGNAAGSRRFRRPGHRRRSRSVGAWGMPLNH
ncbi:hypothetical protein GGF46_004573 [Coemansia sp. RSA 552]|nr:hypothetical protein GGF46_004573 [Coemansia sp. RSA 552]